MKYLPDPTSWTRCLQFDSNAYANLHHIRVTNKGKGNKIKGFKFFDNCCYLFEQAKCWGVRLTIKLLKHSKVRLTRSLLLHPNRPFFLASGAPSQFFFCGNPARPPPGENTDEVFPLPGWAVIPFVGLSLAILICP